MEGSAALGGAQGGDAGGEQGAEQQQTGGFDPSQLVSSLSAIAEGQNETRELLRSLQEQRAEGGEEGEDPNDPFAGLDLSFLEEAPAVETAEDPQQFTAQLGAVLAQAVEKGVQQQLGQTVAPLQQQVQEMQRAQAAQELADEFPALADPDNAREVMSLAAQLAQANGQPELADQPWFWRLTYMAAEAAAAANDAGGNADPNAANLEGAAGALPGGAGGGDMGDAIVGSQRGARVLPFG